MKRQPSLHISRQNLAKVLLKLDICSSVQESKKLAYQILRAGKKYTLTSRKLYVKTKKVEKKTRKLVMSSTDDATTFSKLLHIMRKRAKHRGINIIKPGSRDWGMIKEVTSLALDFCLDFDLDKEEGFKMYCELGLAKMKKFSLMKFNSSHQSICEEYSALQIIKDDEYPEQTTMVCKIYQQRLVEKSGIIMDYTKMPDKYIYFIEVVKICKELKVKPKDYIHAQFDGLEWANSIPDPMQLTGDKAIQRLNRFLIQHNKKAGQTKHRKLDASKIRDVS